MSLKFVYFAIVQCFGKKQAWMSLWILVCGKLRMFMFKDAGNTSNCNSSLQQCRWALAHLNSWFTTLPTMVLKILRIDHVFPHSYASEKNNLAKKFVFCMELFHGVNANVKWRRWWWLHPPRTARSSGKYLILRWILLICCKGVRVLLYYQKRSWAQAQNNNSIVNVRNLN